jgi:carbon-monoxide dehydrogenase medium subunit
MESSDTIRKGGRRLKDIEYASPRTLAEAIAILKDGGERARVLAGGTDIIVQLREYRRDVDVLVDVKRIPELNALEWDLVNGLTIGAAVPCYRIYAGGDIASAYPGLMDAVRIIGGAAIQGRATIGGNLCNASPAADSIPALIAHGATCTIQGTNGRRDVKVEDFCVAPGRTVLTSGELLVSIRIPAPMPRSRGCYLRFIPRNEMDIAVVGVGAHVTLDGTKRRIASARIALAAVAPTPLFVPEAGQSLAGSDISDDVIERAARIAQDACRPISDMRGTAEQRKHLVGVLTRRALNGAIERAQEAS